MNSAQAQLLSSLREQLDHWHADGCAPKDALAHSTQRVSISSGCQALDRFLPQGGFLPGQLIEWLGAVGSPRATLALMIARQAATAQLAGNVIVVVDAMNDFYPPAAADWGIDLERLVIIRPSFAKVIASLATKKRTPRSAKRRSRAARHADLLWALDQSLRCPAVAAVWSYLPSIDTRSFRRLQLAAEEGRTLALLIRDTDVRGQPSWSDMQICVRSLPSCPPSPAQVATPITVRRCALELVRCRRGTAGRTLELTIDEITSQLYCTSDQPGTGLAKPSPRTLGDEHSNNSQAAHSQTHSLSLAAQLARPAMGRREASI